MTAAEVCAGGISQKTNTFEPRSHHESKDEEKDKNLTVVCAEGKVKFRLKENIGEQISL